MNNYFIEELRSFLNEHILKSLKIQNISTWRKNNFLKITIIIKKYNSFANIEECASVHKLVKIWIKKENIQDKVQVEIQSESIDKKLIHIEDFQENINQLINIETKDKINDQRHFKGFLIDVKNGTLFLKDRDNEYALNFFNIKKAKIVP